MVARAGRFDGDGLVSHSAEELQGRLWQGKKKNNDVAVPLSESSTALILGTQWEYEDAEEDDINDDYDDSFEQINSFKVNDSTSGDSATRLGPAREAQEDEQGEEENVGGRQEGGGKGRGKGRGKGKGERKLGTGDGRFGAGRGQVKANARKEQNKAKVANHNRKAGASRKQRA